MAVSKKKRWQMLEEQIKAQIERDTDFSLFKELIIGEKKENSIKIFVRDNFSKNSITKQFSKNILNTIKQYDDYNEVDILDFEINGEIFREHDVYRQEIDNKNKIKNAQKETLVKSKSRINKKNIDISDILYLNDKYTFEQFVIGSSNELAYFHALSVAKEPGTKSNPLFIYGGSGLGKTHLMQAVGHYIYDNSGGRKKIAYVTTEKFTNDFLESLQSKTTTEFRDKYRQVDVLLIDDIQFLVGKTETQKEFFNTFNDLVEKHKKQIILTSDKPPAKLDKLEERLVSRFKAGAISDIQKPNLELRIAILKKEAQEMNVDIKNEIIEYIAQQVVSNIRELEGAFNTILTYKTFTKRELSIEVIDRILKDFIAELGPKKISIEDIQNEVVDYYRINKEELLSAKRDQRYVVPRQMAMFLARDLTGKSTTIISKEFGKKDHTTVIHACKKIQQLMKENSKHKEDFNELRRKLLE